MTQWINHADLSNANSLGLKVTAERLIEVNQLTELVEALNEVEAKQWPLLILGGGSNLVLQPSLPGAVIRIAAAGVHLLADDNENAIVEVGAGENWHQFVCHLLTLGLHGLENLALIPGTVGAAPVQNIGAYGVEVSDCLHSVIAYDRQEKTVVQLMAEECQLSYRNSLFKSIEPGRYVIWRVRFRLSTCFAPKLHYGALQEYLDAQGQSSPTPVQLVAAVCAVRRSKLPDPDQLGNAGSFFENPRVSAEQYIALKQAFTDLVAYPEPDGKYKLAAGWLIDQAGWKGQRKGNVGVYDKQALVLVNYAEGSFEALLELAEEIRASVYSRFGVSLEMEPRIYPPL
ncbi:UDP-N-acetylmuramate dehydrogenase [Neptuniibacter sp. CAU 1671]|uniref:UDP-N-acetylmuramate dehydrogenase n=1 Tax=Neptuniibacter sp. CAU 1671 TaxID=3032593 RepID=UPI0023DB7B82|nr:UDP-N-acetylmuramate dehydrogenase [Neptuniibacter sp. CAU 1671]MDF2180801.1 UDP-N-acetylmuramate dehydrogenase [Neptuniibacter sp. CAU 1671]